MNRRLLPIAMAALVSTIGLNAWAQTSEVAERKVAVPRCDRPVAKVMIAEIKCKSVDCGANSSGDDPRRYKWWERMGTGNSVDQPSYSGVGTGMTEMLATALSQTGCFEVMERAALDEINQELALVGRKVEAEAADFMVTGSITSLGFEQSSTGLGALGFLPKPIALLAGSVDYKKSKVWMNMDIRLVNINKAKLITSRTFEANNQRSGFGMSAAGWAGVGIGGSHAAISGSPLEEVARDVLVRSTAFVAETLAPKNIVERVEFSAKKE
jgi:curli biogenesis system outer membrane secretion channel CsgG